MTTEQQKLDNDAAWQQEHLDNLRKQKVKRLQEENDREQRNLERQFADITESDIQRLVTYCSDVDNVKKEFSYREGLRLMSIGAYLGRTELKSIGLDFVKRCEMLQ
jgi:hypothetical protein